MTPPLGDFFPEDYKESFVQRNLKNKAIIVTRIENFDITYDKFVILIAQSDCGGYFGGVVINTDPCFSGEHILIKQSDHDNFLEYDSFINCTFIKPLGTKNLEDLLEAYPEKHLGEISDQQHKDIIAMLRNCRTIERKVKRLFNLI